MAPSPVRLTGNAQGISDFIDRFEVFLFDCDGVLWSGDHVFPGTQETLEMLRSKGNSTSGHEPISQAQFVHVLSCFRQADRVRHQQQHKVQEAIPPEAGINGHPRYRSWSNPLARTFCTDIEEEEVFGSSYSASIYISRLLKLPESKKTVFVLGESGIEEELKSENVPYIGGADPAYRRDMEPSDYEAIASGKALDDSVGVVLAGLDFHVNYLKLSHAFAYLQRGALFLATNVDSTLPNAHSFFPGAGSVMAPLSQAIGHDPMAFGKPSQAMMDAIEGKFQFDRSKACMVGDRLNTDIKFGIEGRLGGTLAVLTGVSKKEEWEVADAETVPAFYAEKLSDLLEPASE